jgi:hypothetical protein
MCGLISFAKLLYADEEELEAERQRSVSAEQRAARLQRELHEANDTVKALQARLTSKEVELTEAHDSAETQRAAIDDLEASFSRLERAAEGRPSSSARGRSPSASSSRQRQSSPSVSRELVHVRLAEADLQRKLKVSAREALSLRQQLNARTARVTELKDALEAKSRTVTELRRKLEARGVALTTPPSKKSKPNKSPIPTPTRTATAKSPRKKLESRSMSPPHDAEMGVGMDEVGAGGSASEGSELYAELSSRGEPGLRGAVAELKMEVARRDAAIQRLEGRLLESVSGSADAERGPRSGRRGLRRVLQPSAVDSGEEEGGGRAAEREELYALRREVSTALSVAGLAPPCIDFKLSNDRPE